MTRRVEIDEVLILLILLIHVRDAPLAHEGFRYLHSLLSERSGSAAGRCDRRTRWSGFPVRWCKEGRKERRG
jgi:hypothetical protein